MVLNPIAYTQTLDHSVNLSPFFVLAEAVKIGLFVKYDIDGRVEGLAIDEFSLGLG